MPSFETELNRKRWSGKLAGFQYRHAHDLFPPEQTILNALAPTLAGKTLLDIGVGSGRTTSALKPLAGTYVGIDYSPEMIRRARIVHPDASFHRMDARDLSEFPDGQFDCVWFSFNGLDYSSHQDRVLILSEIHRVLKPGAVFCFSSHNRDFARLPDIRRVAPIEPTQNLVKLGYRIAMDLYSRMSAWRLARYEIETDDYAILNDTALNHRLLSYYISMPKQLEQLAGAGFDCIAAYGVDGEKLAFNQPYRTGFMTHYRCVKQVLDAEPATRA